MHRRNAVGRGKDPELPGEPGQHLQRLLRFLAIALLVGESVQPQQRDGSHGISRGSGRILKRLAPRAQHSQGFLGSAGGGVEKAAGHGVKEALDHLVRDALREIEIAEVGGGLVGIEAGDRGEGVIVQQAGTTRRSAAGSE